MRFQFIFGPALLVVGCWCLFVWQSDDETRLLSGIQQGTKEREYRELGKREQQIADALAQGATVTAENVAAEREELDTKWADVQSRQRGYYLMGGASSAGLGVLLVLWGVVATGKAAHARKERAHQRESTHHH